MRCFSGQAYNLQELEFIGGEHQELRFVLRNSEGKLINIENLECAISFSPIGRTFAEPALIKSGSSVTTNVETPYIKIELSSLDTLHLYGKFIYQLSLKDLKGNTEFFQGIATIINNTHKNFIDVAHLF